MSQLPYIKTPEQLNAKGKTVIVSAMGKKDKHYTLVHMNGSDKGFYVETPFHKRYRG